MTNKQRRILEDAEISSELMHEVDHYLKDVGAVLSGTIHEKENYLTMLCNDIAEFVDVNPSASINNIIGEFGTPEKHADVFLENKMKDKPETIRKRLVFHRVIAIAAVLVNVQKQRVIQKYTIAIGRLSLNQRGRAVIKQLEPRH